MIFFEDIEVGATIEHGSIEVTREEVIEFATRYDPQPFHLSDEAAAQTHFGKISASGWNTGALVQRVIVESWMSKKLMGLGSPGLDELRWLKPVFPGDMLTVTSQVTDKRASRSRPERGSIWSDVSVHNQNDDLVMRYTVIFMMLRRPD